MTLALSPPQYFYSPTFSIKAKSSYDDETHEKSCPIDALKEWKRDNIKKQNCCRNFTQPPTIMQTVRENLASLNSADNFNDAPNVVPQLTSCSNAYVELKRKDSGRLCCCPCECKTIQIENTKESNAIENCSKNNRNIYANNNSSITTLNDINEEANAFFSCLTANNTKKIVRGRNDKVENTCGNHILVSSILLFQIWAYELASRFGYSDDNKDLCGVIGVTNFKEKRQRTTRQIQSSTNLNNLKNLNSAFSTFQYIHKTFNQLAAKVLTSNENINNRFYAKNCSPTSPSNQSQNYQQRRQEEATQTNCPRFVRSIFGLNNSSNEEFNNHQNNRFFEAMSFCCCCLCYPVHRCAILLCIIELIVSLTVWYNTLDLIAKTYEVLQLKDVIFILFMSSWIITLCTSTFTLILAHRKKRSEFVLPRLIQQAMLLIVGFLIAILIVIYFSGGAVTINNAIIKIYESVMLKSQMSSDDRRRSSDALRYCFIVLILLDFLFICYMAFGLSITKKFHTQLKRNEYRHAPQSVERSTTGYGPSPNVGYKQRNPTAPPQAPPPYNPHYVA